MFGGETQSSRRLATVASCDRHLFWLHSLTTIICPVRSDAPGILPAITIDRTAASPLYRQIYDGYREASVDRRLRGGQRLPSTRALAVALRISRIPVLNAFEQLLAEGYFESRRGSGTFVAASLPAEAPAKDSSAAHPTVKGPGPRVVAHRPAAALRSTPEPWLGGFGAFRLSEPAMDHFPLAVWSRLVARNCRGTARGEMAYGSAMGFLRFRAAIRRLPAAHCALGALRSRADHGGERFPAGARDHPPHACCSIRASRCGSKSPAMKGRMTRSAWPERARRAGSGR